MKAYIKPGNLPDAPEPTRAHRYYRVISGADIKYIRGSSPKVMNAKREKAHQKANHPSKPNPLWLTDEEKQTIIELRRAGKTYSEIGKAINRSKSCVNRFCLTHQTAIQEGEEDGTQ